MLRMNQIVGLVFSEVDVRLVDCVFSAKGDHSIRQWAEISRQGMNDVALAMRLKDVLSEKQVLSKNAALTLPDSGFLLKTVSLPKISRKDIKKYLEREVSKGLALPARECFYDFLISNERESSGLKKIDLSVLAAPRTTILRYAGIIMEAGLTPAFIGPSSMAMLHLMTLNAPPVSGPFALIYLGATKTTITIADGDHVVFTRRLNLSPFTKGLSERESRGDTAFDDALREIKRTLLYCKKDVIGQEVLRLIAAAAVPLSEAQLSLLREKLNVEVLPWRMNRPEQDASEEAREKMSEGYLFALGAGVCAAEGSPLQILPWSLKWKSYEGRALALASIILLAFLIGGLWACAIQKAHLMEAQTLALKREAQLAEAQAAREAEEARITARHELKIRQEILSRLMKRRPDFQHLFQALSRGMPDEARFDSVVIKQENREWVASLKGRTFWEENIEQVEVFADLAANLQRSGQFGELAFHPVESRPELSNSGMPFELKVKVQ